MLAYKKVVWSIQHWLNIYCLLAVSQVAFVAKNLSANLEDTRDTGSVPRSGRSPGGGNGNPL